MFSFLRRKNSPSTPPDEDDIITNNNGNNDGFVVVGQERPTQLPPLYPMVPPVPSAGPQSVPTLSSPVQVHYLAGVPFKLAQEFDEINSFNINQSEIDHILAFMTRQLSVDGEDYDFSLEREIIAQQA